MVVKIIFFSVALVVIFIARRIAIMVMDGTIKRRVDEFKGVCGNVKHGFRKYVFKTESSETGEKSAGLTNK